MNRLTVVAVAAIVALASGVALVRYVAGAEDRATATAELVPILVATADIADGTPFSEAWEAGDIAQSEILQGMRPDTAIVDQSELAGAVADGVLFKGQLVVQGVFVAPGDGDAALPRTFADSLPDGTVAVSFEAAGAQAVSDLVSPGDRIDLLVQVPNAAELGLPDSGGPAIVRAFHNLQVIAIGAAVAPSEGSELAVENPGGGSYSVAVSPRDAARLLFLTRQYEVFLTLIGPGATDTAQDPVTGADALPDGVTAADAVAVGEDANP